MLEMTVNETDMGEMVSAYRNGGIPIAVLAHISGKRLLILGMAEWSQHRDGDAPLRYADTISPMWFFVHGHFQAFLPAWPRDCPYRTRT